MTVLLRYLRDFLPMLAWIGLWAGGGWLIAARIFSLKRQEQTIIGIGLGLVLSNWIANFLARIVPLAYAFWLSALIVLVLGLALAWPLFRGKVVNKISISLPQLLLLGVLTIVFTAIGRGLAIYDDYSLLPHISIMATGDIPPHYSLNPSLRFDYHYFLLLFVVQLMRVGQMYPWNALDLARGLVLALTLMLGGLWAWRVTHSRLAGFLSALFLAFAGGARWLLLLMPSSLLKTVSAHIDLIGAGAQSGTDLSAAVIGPFNIQGDGPVPFPFVFSNGMNMPLVTILGGIGTINVLILLLLLLTYNRWRHWSAGILTTILVAALALSDEVIFVLLYLGLALAVLLYAIQHRTIRIPRTFLPWIAMMGAAGLLAVLQGGMLTSIILGWFEQQTAGSEATLFTYHFSLAWPPAFISTHLGVLSVGDPVQLLVAFMEMGAVILALPLVLIWGVKMVRMQRWFQAGLVGIAIGGLSMLFVQYTGDAGVVASGRFTKVTLLVCKICAVPLVWVWAKRYGERVKIALVSWGLVAIFGGLVLFSIQMIAIQKPVYSFFINVMDVQMERDYWDQLEPNAMVFDPEPNRAATVFGRPVNAASSWFKMTPEWRALVETPDPYLIHAAGFDYMYFDISYWENLSTEYQAMLQDPCVRLVKQYDGFRSERDYRKDFRRLLDIKACQ